MAVAVGSPVLAAVLWGVLAAPRSAHRLPVAARVPFELAVFALGTLAFLASAGPPAGIVNVALLSGS